MAFNKIPNEIKQELDAKRKRALEQVRIRLNDVGMARPEIAALRRLRLKTSYDYGLKIQEALEQSEITILKKELSARLEEWCMEEARILREMGLPADYLSPRFSCSDCEDTGLCGFPVQGICKCTLQRMAQTKYATSNLENGEYFESFNSSIYRDARQRAHAQSLKEYAQKYADELPHTAMPDILLMGSTGLGKSFMLNCIGHRALERGLEVLKITAYNLVNSILDSVRSHQKPEDFVAPDLLLIDDLGSEAIISNITREHFFAIINERQARYKNTVIATNLSAVNLQETYGERLFSRIISPKQTKIFTLTGDDLRFTAGN